MTVERFTEAHLPMLNAWCEAYGDAPWAYEDLPEIGYIAGGCVAAWLFQTDGAVALIENMISDPAVDGHLRTVAAGRVHGLLIEEAKSHGFKLVASMTTDPRMESIFKRRCVKTNALPYIFIKGLLDGSGRL